MPPSLDPPHYAWTFCLVPFSRFLLVPNYHNLRGTLEVLGWGGGEVGTGTLEVLGWGCAGGRTGTFAASGQQTNPNASFHPERPLHLLLKE